MKKYNVITTTDLGTFIINKNDIGVGWQLSEFGTYDPNEISLMRQVMHFLRTKKENLIALDVGANIGIHSVILSSEVGGRRVYSFEAQRIIFNMLCGNIAINSLENVLCYHNAVSDVNELINIPQFNYGMPMSFGSVEFAGVQNEKIGQEPRYDLSEKVSTIVLDDVSFQQVDFMKIDVEGMEHKVLKGSDALIKKFKPIIFLEYLKSDSNDLIEHLVSNKYNIYSGIGAIFLCFPENFAMRFDGLEKIA